MSAQDDRLGVSVPTGIDDPVTTAGLSAEDDGADPKKASARTTAAVLLIALGIGFGTLMPALVALPVVIARITPDSKEVVLGTALSLQALLQLAFAPVFGAISDRTTSRFGMRRPGIAIGGASIVSGLIVLGLATSVPLIYVGVVLMALGASLSNSSSFAIIPDQFPDSSRGRILGFKALVGSLAGLLASIIGPLLLSNQLALFGMGACVLGSSYALALILLRDRRLVRAERSTQTLISAAFSGYKYNPRSAPDFSWVFVSRFVFTLGIAFATTFAVYFMTDELEVSEDRLPGLIALNSIISLAGTAFGTLVGGFIADKVRSRKSLVIVWALIFASGAIIAGFAPSVPLFFLGTSLITVSIGAFIPTDGALVMSVLPGGNKQAGKFMAIIGIADQLPRSLGSAIGPAIIALGALLAVGGYRILYIAAAASVLAGGLIVRKVRGAR